MRIINRYFLKSFIPIFIFGIFLFTSILIVSPLFEIMDLIISRSIEIVIALRIFILKIPPYLTYTFPMAIFLAVIYIIGQFIERGEITAMKASGASLSNFLPPLLIFSFGVLFLMFYFNEIISPKAIEQEKILYQRAISKSIPIPDKEDVFFKDNNNFYFFKKFSPQNQEINDALIIQIIKDDVKEIITAKKAKWYLNQGWIFYEGKIYVLNSFGDMVLQGKFEEKKVILNRNPNQIIPSIKPINEMSIWEIIDQIRLFQGSGISLVNLWTEFYIRFALPFTCPIFALLALGLGLQTKKGGRSLSFGLSVITIFVYYIIFSIGRSLAKAGILSPIVGAWLGNIVFLFVSFIFLRRKL
ncbi:MAG: LptF/LptG family permease [Dictyoglomaceae bacterium]|nr:LptF/LptG family permease [Dictyoglomaceae bacterium]